MISFACDLAIYLSAALPLASLAHDARRFPSIMALLADARAFGVIG